MDGSFGSYGGLTRLWKEGRLNEALLAVNILGPKKSLAPMDMYYHLVRGCMNKKDLTAGKEVYQLLLHTGIQVQSFLGSHLIRMFAVCGSLWEANLVFSKLLEPSVFTWSAIISAHATNGQGEQAIELYHHMQQSGVKSDAYVVVAVLNACASTASLKEGKVIHTNIINNGFRLNPYVASSLIDMYVKCERLEDAVKLFQMLPKRDVVTWNAMMSGYAQHGHGQEVFALLKQMQHDGVELNTVLLVTMLKTCANVAGLDEGMLIHAEITQRGLDLDIRINNSLISMYAKCRSFEDACRVFERMLMRDVVSWNAVIAGCVCTGHYTFALEHLQQMQQEGEKPDNATLVTVLKACSSLADLGKGKLVHAHIIESGMSVSLSMVNTLIDMYAKCGSLEDALRLFDSLSEQAMVTWSVMIAGCAQQGQYDTAFKLLQRVQEKCMKLDSVALVAILKACPGIPALNLGRLIHSYIISSCFESECVVGTALIDLYAKSGSLEDAQCVFDRLQPRDVVTWTAIIAGYAQHGHGQMALQLFERMQEEGIKPNKVTFLATLRACYEASYLHRGKLLHCNIIEGFLELDTCIGNTLINLYIKCRSFEDGKSVFVSLLKHDDVVSWNAMLQGYFEHGHTQAALSLFQEMLLYGITPDNVTFYSILKACSELGQGRVAHHQIIESCFEVEISVTNTLIDMYAKCGSLEDACKLFNKLSQHDAVTWSAMTTGYLSYERWQEAFGCLQNMPDEYLKLDSVLFLSLLEACSSLAALDEGRCTHSIIVECAFETDMSVGSSLIDMYANSGSVEDARLVFDMLPKRDSATWNAIISTHADNRDYKLALKYLEGMQKTGLKPDMVTFVHLLCACRDMGLAHEGFSLFKSMREGYGIIPNLEHYNCLVGLLGFAGKVEEAEDLLCTLPFSHNLLGWMSLLNHCRKHGIVDLARHCFLHIISFDKSHPLMTNIDGDSGMYENGMKHSSD